MIKVIVSYYFTMRQFICIAIAGAAIAGAAIVTFFENIVFLLLYMYSKLVKKPQTLVLATHFGPTSV